MYSIPQQAVTNGYWKMETFRAQPRAASTFVVNQFDWPNIRWSPRLGLPLQGPFFPRVDEAEHHHRQEEEHLEDPRPPQSSEHHRPREEEHQLDVEQDEQHRHEVELHGEPAARLGDGRLAALEWLLLDGGGLLRAEQRGQQDEAAGDGRGDGADNKDPQVFRHGMKRQYITACPCWYNQAPCRPTFS